MPSASNIVLADGQATPANHTFEPKRIGPDLAVFSDRDSTTSAGQKQLILGFSATSANRSTDRVTMRIAMPIEQVVDGVTVVAYTARVSCDVVIPESLTQAQRDDLAAFFKNAAADAIVQGMITDLDPVY